MNKFLNLNRIKKLIPLKIFKAIQPVYHYCLAAVAAAVYRWPSERLIVIGVTGTTGKTTSTYLIARTLEEAGFKVGFTSTAIFNDGQREWLNDKKMTMVGRFFTQRMLRSMVDNGCQYALVETTSEGVRQFRHQFINYDVLVFTGLYPEHIESHGSFENYKAAKGKLFAYLKRCKTKYVNEEKRVVKHLSGLKKIDLTRVKKTIIANLNDEHAGYFLDFWSEEKYGYANIDQDAGGKTWPSFEKIKYGNVQVSQEGIEFKIENHPSWIRVRLHLLGAFNAGNAMNAVAVARSQGLDIETIKEALEKIAGVAGRLERIDEGQPFAVIVDYAFEPNAVAKLYETVKILPHNRIIHVFGSAGGGRDVARRPVLGKLAGSQADIIIVTDEDPYDDDPAIIIDQVAVGAEHAGKRPGENLYKILDRREAIVQAIGLAEAGDIVLITGKGSEQAIAVAGGEKITWDDRAVVRGILRGESVWIKDKN